MGVEERLAHVGGLVAGHAQLLGDLRTSITNIDLRMERGFERLDGRITYFEQKSNTRFEALDAKIDGVERRLDAKIDEKFRWMLGLQMTLVAVVLASILAR